MRIEVTKELKITLLQILKQGYITEKQSDELRKTLNESSCIMEDIPDDKLDAIEKILYPD